MIDTFASLFQTRASRFRMDEARLPVTFRTTYPPSLWPCQAQMWRVFLLLIERRLANNLFAVDRKWLEKMRDYISASGSVDREHLEADNVLGPIYKSFGERLWPLMEELNLTLAA
jgi:hypothetical protein